MSFLFVDKITDSNSETVTGQVTFTPDSKYVDQQGIVYPGIISEAIGQLASWKTIHDNGFSGRPVFLFADNIHILGVVGANDPIELSATIHQQDHETLVFSGTAKNDCKEVVKIEQCSGYFMPLAELEDPEITQKRFNELTSSKGAYFNRSSDLRLDAEIDGYQWNMRGDTQIFAECSLPDHCSFYKDHFPRFPVTPIVVINELIGGVCCKLLQANQNNFHLVEIRGIKIREFIKPGESFSIQADLKELLTVNRTTTEALIQVQIKKSGKNVLRGRYIFRKKTEGN